MKTPSLPKTIKPFDIVAAVKRALKKETPEENQRSASVELDRMHDLFIVNAWGADFGHEPTSASGRYFWTPGSASGAFTRYRKALPAACTCVAWNLKFPASVQCKEILDFYGKFNVVDGISRLLFEKDSESKKPEYKGQPILFKAVSYEFGGDIMKSVPKDYNFQFDVGGEHYNASLSEDYKTVSLTGKETKTFKTDEFPAELDRIIKSTDAATYVDLAAI